MFLHAPYSRHCVDVPSATVGVHQRDAHGRRVSTLAKHAPCRPRAAPTCNATQGNQFKSEKAKRDNFKNYDEAFVTVRSGNGGNGEIAQPGGGKQVRNFKYKPGGNLPKQIWLPAGEPADGAPGADVIFTVDPALDSLLPLAQRPTYRGKDGSNGNPAQGTGGSKKRGKVVPRTPPLRVGVPPGTVVRRKRGGAVLGELINVGDTLCVARGGRGGVGVVAPKRDNAQPRMEGIVVVEDDHWQADAKGQPGEELALHLQLRVVADVGLVGFPNAGKSSLLQALTAARPAVAPYPFTTLTPNLGVYAPQPAAAEDLDEDDWEAMAEGSWEDGGPRAVLADLPGLIQGAHVGRGLGRNFLRHLRRTSALLHVVDAAAQDPAADYWAVREELRMYNPEYVAKPHVVALNKMDLEDAHVLQDDIRADIQRIASDLAEQHADVQGAQWKPLAIVACSAVSGQGLDQLRAALEGMLRDDLL